MDPLLALSDIGLQKFVALSSNEGNPCLGGHSLCQQGLAGAGRAVKQYSLGWTNTGTQILLGIPKVFHKILQLLLCVIRTDNLVKGHIGFADIAHHILGIICFQGDRLSEVKQADLCDLSILRQTLSRFKVYHFIGFCQDIHALLLMQMLTDLVDLIRKDLIGAIYRQYTAHALAHKGQFFLPAHGILRILE